MLAAVFAVTVATIPPDLECFAWPVSVHLLVLSGSPLPSLLPARQGWEEAGALAANLANICLHWLLLCLLQTVSPWGASVCSFLLLSGAQDLE